MNDAPITLKGALMATFIGAVSGVVTCGIGDAVAHTANFALKSSLQALMHGAFQGTLSGITGGGFWAGAASGALSSIASSAFSGGENTKLEAGKRVNAGGGWKGAGKFAKSTTGMIAFGTVMGGAGAALTGGNFWQGAVTGLVVSGLNHAAHAMMERKDLVARMKKGNINPSGKPDFTQAGVDRMNSGVEGLDEEYRAGGSPKVSFDSTDPTEAGHTDPGHVHLNTSKITSNYRYASVLFHEYRHAWQWMYKYDGWYREYGVKTAGYLMERDAYGHSLQIGIYNSYDLGDSLIKENFDLYYNLTNHIKHF